MRLLLDEHFDKRLALTLRERGHDVRAVTEVPDLIGADDPVVLTRCVAESCVLVTRNVRDFTPLVAVRIAEGEPLVGVLFVSRRTFPGGGRAFGRMLEALAEYLGAHPEAELPYGTDWL